MTTAFNNKNITRLFIAIAFVSSFVFGAGIASAASFIWTQNSWAGGASATHASHLTDLHSTWTYYTAATGTSASTTGFMQLLRYSNGVN
jgi:hypothetical protein